MAAEFEGLAEKAKPVVLTPAGEAPAGGLRVRHLMSAIILCALLVTAWIKIGAWFFVLAVVLLIMGAVGLAVVLAQRGATQQESLLWALAIAAERSLPLAPATLAFADQFSGTFRARTYHLAALLNEGVALPDAVGQVPGLLGPEARALVRVGWESGTLAHALRVAAAFRAARHSAWGAMLSRFLYLAVVLFHVQSVIVFISYFIVPKFEAIFKDFGLSLPAVTIYAIQATHVLMRFWPLTFLLLLAEFVLLVLSPLMLLGSTVWDLPLVDLFLRRRHATLILRALALTAEGGRPVPAGLEALARVYPSGWVRRRLVRVVREAERGGDWAESLAGHGLIRPSDEAVIASAQRAGNLAWALGELAETNERRLGYRLQLWLQMLFPALILAVGSLVFWMAVAYFSPIVRLIEALS